MYNLHQYTSAVLAVQKQQKQNQKYAKYVLRHEDLKQKATERIKQRAKSFIQQQSQNQSPFIFEDDHYKHWRPLKQFRDIEDSKKFLSYKTFRHKPHYQMDKYYNERQRKEIRQLSQKKQHLVRSGLIPEAQRARSLRCQGPLNPKIQFRKTKKDHEYLQPRLRFSNITDRERMNQTNNSYDDKFQSLYKSFEMTKSKIGVPSISLNKSKKLAFLEQCDSDMVKSKSFHYEKQLQTNSPASPSNEYQQGINPQNSQLSSVKQQKSKTYFKLAKTLQLFHEDNTQKQQIQNLLKRTQYERKKDLSNLRYNIHHQNYFKRPIL